MNCWFFIPQNQWNKQSLTIFHRLGKRDEGQNLVNSQVNFRSEHIRKYHAQHRKDAVRQDLVKNREDSQRQNISGALKCNCMPIHAVVHHPV